MQKEFSEDELRINFPMGKEEYMENILKHLYGMWKNGDALTMDALEHVMRLEKNIIILYLEALVEQGYMELVDKNIELTSLGKAQGAEYKDRHKALTQFIQTICRVDEEEAKENACRLEHVISKKVEQGFYDFVRVGSSYEREVTNTNLKLKYKEGSYTFVKGIYMAERRFPRVLAREDTLFKHEVVLSVRKDTSYFYLQKQELYSKNIWFLRDGEWELAMVTVKGVRIPTEIFRFSVDVNEPIIEGDAIIAFSSSSVVPRGDYRELNIHMW